MYSIHVQIADRRDHILEAWLEKGLLLLLFLGLQDRFFARWILPVYPLLCLLAAWAAIEALRRAPAPALIAGALLCAQGLVFSIHNDLVLSRLGAPNSMFGNTVSTWQTATFSLASFQGASARKLMLRFRFCPWGTTSVGTVTPLACTPLAR